MLIHRSQNQSSDPNIGSASNGSDSAVVLQTTILPSLCITVAVLVFVALGRNRLSSIYAPKLLVRNHGASAGVTEGRFSWMARFYQTKDVDLLKHHNIDSYLLLRYLRLCVLLCLGGCATLCPVLLSLNATGNGGMHQLNMFSIANIEEGSARLYAHSCCTIVYFGWVMYMMAQEKLFCLELRHARYALNGRTQRSDSRTVLFTNVPKDLQDISKMKATFGNRNGLRVWLVTRTESLRRDLKRRDAIFNKLDTIWTKYPDQLLDFSSESSSTSTESSAKSKSRTRAVNDYSSELKSLGIEKNQERHKRISRGEISAETKDPSVLLPCVFVRFGTVEEAQLACRSRHHIKLSRVTPRCVDTSTREIIWKNLRLSWKSVLARRLLSQVFIIAMIVFWSFPVAFVTAMTNINAIFPNLRWEDRAPTLIQKALNGLLPSMLLSLLMSLPPRIVILLGNFAGLATLAEVETHLQRYYFWFRFVQVFLVAALGSTASSVFLQIYADPSSTTTILAKRLPGASNFYFSYLVVQGLSESAFVLLNVYGLFSRFVLTPLLDDTPRKKSRRQSGCFEISAGTVSATCSSLLVIALCYAPAAPLMLCFATLAFAMFYLSYRHNLLFTSDLVADTRGRFYVRALQHTMVGIYMGELFLIGLLTINAVDGHRARGPLILAGVLLACTILYQRLTYEVFKPWESSVPGRKMQNSLRVQGPHEQGEVILDPDKRSQSRMVGLILDDLNSVVRKLAELDDQVQDEDGSDDYFAPELTEQVSPIVLSGRSACEVKHIWFKSSASKGDME